MMFDKMRPGAFIILALFAVLLISNVAADDRAVKNTEEAIEVKSYDGGRDGGWGGRGGSGGWGGGGGGGGGWGGGGGGCRWGRCGCGYYGGGCRCCYSAQEAIAYMQNEANP